MSADRVLRAGVSATKFRVQESPVAEVATGGHRHSHGEGRHAHHHDHDAITSITTITRLITSTIITTGLITA